MFKKLIILQKNKKANIATRFGPETVQFLKTGLRLQKYLNQSRKGLKVFLEVGGKVDLSVRWPKKKKKKNHFFAKFKAQFWFFEG